MRNHPLLRACALTLLITCAALLYRGQASSLADVDAAEKSRSVIPADRIHVDDGDSIDIRWQKRTEHVRILGIDAPEVLHLDHDIPHAQPFGNEAMGFLRGCLAVATKIELVRSGERDQYDRTLGYLLLDGRNYSVLVIQARLAYGPNPKFGDNGFPEEYAACVAAAKKAGPLPFEEPYKYRRRMRKLSAWMKKNATYPQGEAK